MASPDDVMEELLNNNDVVVIYDGASGFPEAGRRTGSLRYAMFKLIWDLLRFQTPGAFTTPYTAPVGMRDSISRILYLQERNALVLDAIAAKVGADLTGI